MKRQKKDGTFLKIFECLLYIVLVNLSYYGALVLNITSQYDARNFQAYYNSAILISIISLVVLLLNGTLNTADKSWTENIIIMSISALMIGIFTMAIAFLSREFALPRSAIIMAFVIQALSFSFVKIVIISIIKKTIRDKNILLIGYKEEKEIMISKVLSNPEFKEVIKYFIIPDSNLIAGYLTGVDKVYISDSVERTVLDKVMNLCISNHIPVYIIPKTYEIAIFHSELLFMSDVPFFKVDNIVLSWEKMIIKRIFDILFSLVALIILSPVYIAVALAILISDGAPVIYSQERVTRNNRIFNLYKFRSMVQDAEKSTGAVLASEDDPRITKIGKILRRFWLDELPQLFNVLKGDMSLVGPRPERPVFIEEFSKDIPDFKYRLAVKAGVTGYAQVMGKYTTSAEHKIKFDLLYIQNYSIIFDIKIILETIKKIIMGTLKRGENKDYSYKELLQKYNLREKDKGEITEYHSKPSGKPKGRVRKESIA